MIQFPCPKALSSMTPTADGYHCDFCNDEVTDLTHLSASDLKQWKAENNSKCVVISDTTRKVPRLSLSHFALALMIVCGSSLFTFADAQVEKQITNVKSEVEVFQEPALGLLRVNLTNQYGYATWGTVWVELPNGKELEMLEVEEGKFYIEIPAYCQGKDIHVYAEHLGKKKHVSTQMYQVSQEVKVDIVFRSRKNYRRVVGGYF